MQVTHYYDSEEIRLLLCLFLVNILFYLINKCTCRLDEVLNVLLIHIDNASCNRHRRATAANGRRLCFPPKRKCRS